MHALGKKKKKCLANNTTATLDKAIIHPSTRPNPDFTDNNALHVATLHVSPDPRGRP